MRRGLASIALLAAAAACGGAPSPTVVVPPPANVDTTTLNYTQTATAATTGSGLVYPGFTCRSPQTVITEKANANIAQAILKNQTFNGVSGLTAVTSAISLQGCADGAEQVTETDYFAQLRSSSSIGTSETALVGSTLQYAKPPIGGQAETVTVLFGTPGLVVNELPLQPGRTWTSAATRTVTSTSGTDYQDTLTVKADGSYNDALVELNGIFPYESTTTVENSDGSGSITNIDGANASASPSGESLSAPAGNAVTISPFGTPAIPPDAPSPTPCPTPNGTPCPPSKLPTPYPQYAWYPYTPSVSKPLETITSTDKGSVALPSSCTISATLPTSAELIETIDSTLDVWRGTTTATSDAYLDSHDGLLCLNVYVSFSAYIFGSTSADTTPVQTTTLTFTDSLQNESAPPALLTIPTLPRLQAFYR